MATKETLFIINTLAISKLSGPKFRYSLKLLLGTGSMALRKVSVILDSHIT